MAEEGITHWELSSLGSHGGSLQAPTETNECIGEEVSEFDMRLTSCN
jgi:hypothetical protein